jgi:hypothetical protein
MTTTARDMFDVLPDEVMLMVLDRLANVGDLVHAACVSRRWCRVARDWSLWAPRYALLPVAVRYRVPQMRSDVCWVQEYARSHVAQRALGDALVAQVDAKLDSTIQHTEFDLSGMRLTIVPPVVTLLEHVQKLFLCYNQLSSVPSELGQLTALKYLNLRNNQLSSVPHDLGQLSALQYLYLSHNQLSSVPSELGQLSALQWLYLNNNQLSSVPIELGQLSALRKLHLSNNQLSSVPSELGQLSSLQLLELSNNQLSSVPSELGQLSARGRVFLG